MNRLNILWTSDNLITAQTLISMYTINSLKNNWWDSVNVIIWGGATDLIKNNIEVQELVKQMISNKVTIEACKVCSDKLGCSELLESLGVEVKFMGNPMTKYLKSDDKFITI